MRSHSWDFLFSVSFVLWRSDDLEFKTIDFFLFVVFASTKKKENSFKVVWGCALCIEGFDWLKTLVGCQMEIEKAFEMDETKDKQAIKDVGDFLMVEHKCLKHKEVDKKQRTTRKLSWHMAKCLLSWE